MTRRANGRDASGDDDFGFAIVGCGMIARFHARALAEVPGARVAALVSRNLDNARKLAADLGLDCPACTDLAAALARPDVRAVIVTTPSGAHLEPAVAAADAGKHVVVEKPLEITAERCDRIIEACDRNGVQLCTIFPSRFGDANRALKAAVDGGRFGRLTLAETTCKWWRSQAYYDQGGWKGTQALDGGGALMNQAIHNVDLLLWLMGPVTHVTGFTATLAHERIEVEDTAVACLRFAKRGARRHPGDDQRSPRLAEDHRGPRRPRHGRHRTGRRAALGLHAGDGRGPGGEGALRPQGRGVGRRQRPGRDLAPGPRPPARRFRPGRPHRRAPLVDGREGRRSVEVIEAIYRSARNRTHRPERLRIAALEVASRWGNDRGQRSGRHVQTAFRRRRLRRPISLCASSSASSRC